MSLVRRFIRNCSSFFFLLFCFSIFSVSVFASTNISYPVSFSDCATDGASCTDLRTDVSDIDTDDGTEFGSTNWPDDPFAFSGINWSDNSNPHFIQFNFGPGITTGDVVSANVEYDGIFAPVDCDGECRFKFLSSTNGFATVEEIHSQEDLSLSPVLNLSLPPSQLSSLNSLSLRLLAYGNPFDTSYSGFSSLIDYVKLTAIVDENPPSIPVLQSPIGGTYINNDAPLMQWEDSTDDVSAIKNYLYRIYYNCSNPADIPNSCSSLYPNETGLIKPNSDHQAGSTSDNTFFWQVRAVDETDKVSDWSGLEKFTIDTIQPSQPSLVSPIDNSILRGDVLISDWTNVIDADHYIYESYHNSTATNLRYHAEYGVSQKSASNVADSEFWWKVKAVDLAGNESIWSDLWHVTIDNTAPVVTLNTPLVGFVNGQVIINGSASDLNLNYYRIIIHDDQSQRVANPGKVFVSGDVVNEDLYVWDSTQVLDGNYKIILIVEDIIPNRTTLTRNIIVDNEGPDAPTILTPSAESYFNTTPILATWSEVSDPAGVDHYRIQYKYDDGHTFSRYPYRTTPYTNRNHTPGIGEQGGVSFRVQAFDTLDNEGDWSEWRHYYYDATPPSIPGIPSTSPNPTKILTQNWSWTASTDTGDSGIKGYYQNIYDILHGTDGGWSWLGNVLETSTNLDEGIWQLKVKAEDNAGNEGGMSESLELVVDTTSPDMPELISPSNGAIIKPVDAIFDWTNETDPNGPVTYNYKSSWSGGGNYGPTSTGTTSQINASGSLDRVYFWQVQACDSLDNCSEWSGPWEVTIDSVPPVVTVDPLVINDTTPALSGTYFDEHQIDSLIITVGGQSSDLAILHADGTWTLANDVLSPLADGLYDVVARATDEAGNVGTDTTTDELRVDSIAPTATFTHYIDGKEFTGEIAYVNDINQLTFTGEYVDSNPSSGLKQDSFVIFDAQADGSFAFSANGAKAYCSWRSGANTIPLSGLTDTLTAIPFAYCEDPLGEGEYYMTHQVYDSAIRKDIPSITQFRDVLGLHFVIDTSPPSIPAQMGWTTENPPEGSDYINGTDFENYKTCGESLNYSPMTNFWEPSTDDVGVVGYDREVYSPEGTRIYSTTLSTNYQSGGGAADGATYWSRTRAIDTAGNYSDWSEKCAITYDITPPDTGFIIINNDDPYTNSRDVVLNIFASDATTNISEMAFSDGGVYSNWEPYTTSKNWQLANSDGEKMVRVKFKDMAGNENTSYLTSDTIILDREDPISEPTSPSAGYYNADTWDGAVEGIASDDRSGVSKIEVSIKTVTPENETKYWDGDSWESNQEWLMATNTTNWSYTITSLIQGTYTFYSRATDGAGNTESTGELSGIVYDTSSPQLSWISPTTDTIISGTLVILSIATDNLSGVASVTYSYQRDDGIDTWHHIATKTNPPYQVDWDTTGLTLDTYNLKAVATDNANNLEEITRKVNVAAVISGESGSTPYFGQIYVSWFTDRATTAQVVYDTVSHPLADLSLFNYGYAYTTGVFDLGKTTFHQTILSGLNDQTIYYYRFISAGSPAVVSGEMSNRTFSASGPGSPPSSGPSGGGTPSPLVALLSPGVMGVYTTPALTLPEEGEVLGEEATPTPEPEKPTPSEPTPTSKILGISTPISPLYFLGAGLLISLILMALLFRRK